MFELIQTDNFYFASCMKITRNRDDAYDLMMETATYIEENAMPLINPHTLFYTIALRTWMKLKKPCSLEIDVPDVDFYDKDCIDFAINLLEQPIKDERQYVTFNIFKLYLQLGTQERVAEYTNINRNTIQHHITKFKNIVNELYRNNQ